MAALYSVSGFLSVGLNLAALVDSEARAKVSRNIEQVISFYTGTGSTGDTADMVYVDQIDLTAGQAASDAIDLAALSQAGNSMNMAYPKYICIFYVTGEGRFFLDRGATNGYTGFPADGISVDKSHRVAIIPCVTATSGSLKTLATSETASTGATVSVVVAIIGTSA